MTKEVKLVLTKDMVEIGLVLVVVSPGNDFVSDTILVAIGDGDDLDSETEVSNELADGENRETEEVIFDWWKDETAVLNEVAIVLICRDDGIAVVAGRFG